MPNDDQQLELAAEQEYTIPEEKVIDQRIITFLDDELTVALSESGGIYCSLPGMCNALGLNTQAQSRRVVRTRLLRPGICRMLLKTAKRGYQKTLCFRIDLIASWLSGAETELMRAGAGEKVHEYQIRLAPIATQIFLEVMDVNPRALLPIPQTQPALAPSEAEVILRQVADLREEYTNLAGVVNMMHESMEAMLGEVGGKLDQATELMQQLVNLQQDQLQEIDKLKAKTQGLTKAQQAEVSRAVGIIVRDSKKAGTQIDYRQIFGKIMSRFHVKSYADIPDNRFDEVMSYLRDLWRQATSGQSPEQGSLF